METLRLANVGVETAALRAAATLRAGGVVVYPTDTLYGLGADAFSDEALERVCRLKNRDARRPIHAVFADMAMVEKYARVTPVGRRLADTFLPGPLTLIFDKKDGARSGIARGVPTIGVRIPKNAFCIALARQFGGPYTTTSANKSGEEQAPTLEGILNQLEADASGIDLVIDAGELPLRAPSTVVDVSQGEPVILREGAIPPADIWDAIRSEL